MKIKKRAVCLLLVLALCLPLLAACGDSGVTTGVVLDPGSSERFSEEEIRAAMDCVMRDFRKDCRGCTLKRLAYSEAYFDSWLSGEGTAADGNTIVLVADYVETMGEASAAHTAQPWVLARRGTDADWRVESRPEK